MISREKEADILRLYHAENWKVGTIATQLGVHHTVVQRVLLQAGVPTERVLARPSMADPFVAFIVETLQKYPRLRASGLYDMVRQRGYPGGPDHFRAIVARYRPRPRAEAYLRLRTLAGEQAQVDWGHFGKVIIGRAVRALMAFVMVLSYSRELFLRFFYGSAMANFLRGHVGAFEAFGGVPRVVLYDNLKSAVLERAGSAIRFHPTLMELAAHYRYEPRPVAPARGNEKGRVERAICFIRERFFAARSFTDLADLNRQAAEWTRTMATERRCPEDPQRTVAEVFAEEQSLLRALPDNPFPAEDQIEVSVGKTPYVRFDLNLYSVPAESVRRTVSVHATLQWVRVVEAGRVIASHRRSFGRGEVIECKEHIDALKAAKRAAREHRGLDRLRNAAPAADRLLGEMASRGANLGSATRALTDLLDRFGAPALQAAICQALENQSAHPAAVGQILDQRQHAAHQPPPLPVVLPDDPRVSGLVVHPHALDRYDRLAVDDGSDSEEEGKP
jgi:transposase